MFHVGITCRSTSIVYILYGIYILFIYGFRHHSIARRVVMRRRRILICVVKLEHKSAGDSVLQDEATGPRLPRRQGERTCRRSACMGALRCSSGGLPHCGICYRPPTPRVGPKARLIRVRALCDQAAEVGAPLFGAVRSDSRGWFQCARGCSAGSLSDSWFHNSTPTIRAPDRA